MHFLADVTLFELVIIVVLAAFSAIAGGVAGYGTGALMPLILVPMVGAAPVVPIIAISAMFTNSARVTRSAASSTCAGWASRLPSRCRPAGSAPGFTRC